MTEIQGAVSYSIVQHDDQLLAQQRSEGDSRGTALLVTDQQRSVLQALKVNQTPQVFAYSPYGHRPTASELLSLHGFNGEHRDPATAWYLLGNGYRPFNPVLTRFTKPDDLCPFAKGGLNSYCYCLGDPINRSDQTGHFSALIMSKIGAWKNRAKYVIRTKLVASGDLKPKWKARGLLEDTALDVLARNPSVWQIQNVPQQIKDQIFQRMGILEKAKSALKPHTMRSRTLENLANTELLTTTPEAKVGLIETASAQYELGNQLRFKLRSDETPRNTLSRIREREY